MDQTHATLLLVDDDAMNRDMLSRRLARKGYTVLTAESGPRALEMLGSSRIDAVLLDVMMPGMSGIETLKRVRQSHSVSELPVIMVTAKDRSEDVVDALDLGANDYVTKPLDFPIVLARIRTQVNARRADPLTGLPNRVLFMDRLERLVNRARTPGSANFAVFFLDVDRFKLINDSLGHLAGDELLIGLARRLETSLRASDTVARIEGEPTLARLGGDEFTILLDGVRTAADAQAIADRLLAVVSQPFNLQGRDIFSSVSIGIVMSAPRYERGDDMVRDADTAMYRAKALGKARCEIFDTSMLAAVEQRLQLESDLRHALARNELRVYYQPIVTLSEGQLCGFEALLRWHHPTQGVISPDAFIPVAEETGLIVPIGNWVLQESCRQMRAWDREFPEYAHLMINVNLSARQCMEPNLVRDVARILTETGLRGAAAEAGDHRRRRPGEFRRGGGNPDGAADARRPARPGRLRDGLLRVELPAAVPVPDAEDRPLLRERDGGRRRRQHRNHPGDRLARGRAGDERDRRRRGDRRAAGPAEGPGLRVRAGVLLLQAAGPGRRPRRAGVAEVDGGGTPGRLSLARPAPYRSPQRPPPAPPTYPLL